MSGELDRILCPVLQTLQEMENRAARFTAIVQYAPLVDAWRREQAEYDRAKELIRVEEDQRDD